jgi:cyclic lactone autoinducer peptide
MRRHYLRLLSVLASVLFVITVATVTPASAFIWFYHPKAPKSFLK